MSLKSTLRNTIAPLYIRARLAQEKLQSGVVWFPLDPNFIANPYPTYKELRERDPYHPSPLTKAMVLSRYEDVDAILRNYKAFSNERGPVGSRNRRGIGEQIENELQPSMLSLDPPDHTRLRSLVSRAFTPRQIAKMEDHIRETAHSLLDEVDGQNEFDLMSNLASLLPTVVIAEMIGVPTDDRQQFKAWSDQIIRGLEPNLSEAELSELLDNAEALAGYFAPIIEDRRRGPRDDLVSRLVIAEEAGQTLSHDETQITLRLLLVAGNETTTNLIGNGLKALLEHPEQLELLRQQSELIPTAIEELLRYDSPVQVDVRRLVEDTEIGDKQGKKDSLVTPLIGAANRDPQVFRDPDQLDITREDTGNIAFGRGIHHCLGAPLARLEAKVAFEVLLERFDEIKFGSREPEYRHNIVLRGLEHLDVRVQHRDGRG
ncbi:MAG: cytochrome P450 [Chloroflexi bacterium]|nr:cytochrome P450 [Chloroflexota bacterium]